MEVYKVYPRGGFAANSYILTADNKTCVVIDCGQERVYDECLRRNLTPQYVLLTHCHYDHIGGLEKFYANGVKILCSEQEQPNLFGEANLREWQGLPPVAIQLYKTLRDEEQITLCGMTFTCYLTAGHTSGGMCYAVENALFTGDTLFLESVGRTDLPTGNAKDLVASVKKLFALPFKAVVYTGHGEDTTLEYEKMHNPYVRL